MDSYSLATYDLGVSLGEILDEKCIKERRQDRQGPCHEELLRNVSMKYYIFEFCPE